MAGFRRDIQPGCRPCLSFGGPLLSDEVNYRNRAFNNILMDGQVQWIKTKIPAPPRSDTGVAYYSSYDYCYFKSRSFFV